VRRPLAGTADIPDLPVIRLLIEAGITTICTDGGGILIVRRPHRTTSGVGAAIDKDHATALQAARVNADGFFCRPTSMRFTGASERQRLRQSAS
jgi:carbamate kinase